jgi:N-acetylglucosaminyl-diphospho-decaprenol L-rhamnosyltransferase
MPQVSIIIVSYNVELLLLQCLYSIKKYFPVSYSYEIIVIDNNSTDGSAVAVKTNFPDVILIENKFNNGFSGANNQGIKISKGNIIFLLNPDTELTEHSLMKLFDFVDQNNANIIAAPQLHNTDGSFQNSCYIFPGALQIVLEALFLHSFVNIKTYSKEKLQNQIEVDALSGAALIFKKELTHKIGLLDENLFWMEDIDFCYRNFKTGGRNIYFPDAVIKHHSGQSAKKNYNVSISNQVISKIKYLKKHSGYLELTIAFIFSYMHIITRILIFGVLSFSKINFLKFKAYLFTFKKLTGYLIAGNSKVA